MERDFQLHTPNSVNCLNTIRLLAALQVVWGHSTRWLEIPVPNTINQLLLLLQGVPVFFMLSGFLIWYSIGRSYNFKEYILKRFWRLYPELWVAVIFELIVVLFMCDRPIEWGKFILFAISECTICVYVPSFLHDYGVGGPNGVLWTMFCMMKFYLIGFVMYKYMHNKSISSWFVLLLVLCTIGAISRYVSFVQLRYFNFIWFQSTAPFLWLFAFGTFLAEFWNRGGGRIVKKIWPIALVVSAVVEFSDFDIICTIPDYGYGLIRCVSILIYSIGFAYCFPSLNIKKDISYPIYLYHMTILNILFILGFRHDYILVVIIMLITSILAFTSTIYVGEWSKRKKQTLINQAINKK